MFSESFCFDSQRGCRPAGLRATDLSHAEAGAAQARRAAFPAGIRPGKSGFSIHNIKYRIVVLRLMQRRDNVNWVAMRDEYSPWEYPQSIAASRLVARNR